MRFINPNPVPLAVVAVLLVSPVVTSVAAQPASAHEQSSELRRGLAEAASGRGGGPATPSHKHYDEPKNQPAPAPGAPLAPRLQNLGVHKFPVSTKVARAQLFMNQGLNLTYGFNHAEAARAYAEAARLDPSLAMAYWGQALVLGPNINAPMDPAAEPKALELIQKAVSLKSKATPRERAYIDALATRYTGKPEDRAKADRAYADAMAKVAAEFPNDLDARTLYAESLMDLRPWGYWMRDGRPYDETTKIATTLEQVIAKHKDHPGALHLWIHLWEAFDPKKAEAEADRLVPLMPGAGHMVHMPAHIYQRVGRHADVVRVNLLAAKADEDYIAACKAQGLYPLAYYPHNLHFIWMGASAMGQKQLALESARKLAAAIPAEALTAAPILQGFLVVPYWAMVRFSEWDQILAEKEPAHSTPFTLAAWRYARASALLATDRLADAEREFAMMKTLIQDPVLKGQTTFSSNTGFTILRIAEEVVAGEIAAKKKDWDTAIVHLDRAVRFDDALVYTEPHDWHVPARQSLATVLMAAGRADEAETVLWEDLRRNPDHVWNLTLMAKALRMQDKNTDAALIDARLANASKGPSTW
jgi:tetratricopeptide (TPR) repeat protein